MAKKYHTERITFLVHPEEREFLDNYCESVNKSMSMILRDYVKELRHKQGVLPQN